MAKVITYIHMLIIIQLTLISCNSDDKDYIRKQYIGDLDRLNQKIKTFQFKQANKIKTEEMPPLSVGVFKSIQFQPETISVAQNQYVQFSYPNLGQNLIDLKVQQSQLSHSQMQVFASSRQHFRQSPGDFSYGGQIPKERICSLSDPQILLQKLRKLQHSSFNGLGLQEQDRKQHLIYQSKKDDQYRAIFLNNNALQLYRLKVDGKDVSGQAEIVSLFKLDIQELFYRKHDENYSNQNQAGRLPLFLFHYAGRMLASNGYQIYQIVEENDIVTIGKYGSIVQQSKDQQEPHSILDQPPRKLISLKYGILVQYTSHIQIFIQDPQKLFTSILNTEDIARILNNNKIVDTQLIQRQTHQSGFRIFLLVNNVGVVQFQYGSYTSINIYDIPYGSGYCDFAVDQDILQVVFEVIKGKMAFYYVAQVFMQRKNNPRAPEIFINRFYDDIKDAKKVIFMKKQLLIIGQSDILIYDYPVNSRILIKQNIIQYPYFFYVNSLQQINYLQKISSSDVSLFVFFVGRNQISIAKLTKTPQTVKCVCSQSFDARIQILTYCNQQRETQNMCKYIGSLRVIVPDLDAINIKSLQKYLVIGLILALLISFLIVVRQIGKNKRTIQKLRKLKQKINKKCNNQLQNKGKKLSAQDRFQELNQEVVEDGIKGKKATTNKKADNQ